MRHKTRHPGVYYRLDALVAECERLRRYEHVLTRISESKYSIWKAEEEVQRLKRMARAALTEEHSELPKD